MKRIASPFVTAVALALVTVQLLAYASCGVKHSAGSSQHAEHGATAPMLAPAEVAQVNPLSCNKLPDVWPTLAAKLSGEPKFLEDSLRLSYTLMADSRATGSGRLRALQFFVELEADDVLREALLLDDLSLVYQAAEYVVREPRREALPFLTHALERWNVPPVGSEFATILAKVKGKLVTGIVEMPGLGSQIEPPADMNNLERILGIVQQARAWADAQGLALIEERGKQAK